MNNHGQDTMLFEEEDEIQIKVKVREVKVGDFVLFHRDSHNGVVELGDADSLDTHRHWDDIRYTVLTTKPHLEFSDPPHTVFTLRPFIEREPDFVVIAPANNRFTVLLLKNPLAYSNITGKLLKPPENVSITVDATPIPSAEY